MKFSNELANIDLSLLMCPGCNLGTLEKTEAHLSCNNCENLYRTADDKIFFTENYFNVDTWESKSTEFDLLKRGKIAYRKIDKLGGPRMRDLKSYLNVHGVALNLGSGADHYDGYVNIDLGKYPHVHLVSSLTKIPYKDSSVDLLVSNSVLEHIDDYPSVIKEIYRVLKPGGYLYLCVPNLCMRHHEYDYHRWTMPGLLSMLQQFEIIENGSCRGVAYTLDTLVEALIVCKTNAGMIREILRRTWLFMSKLLYRIKSDNSDEYVAMSQTIYAIARKK